MKCGIIEFGILENRMFNGKYEVGQGVVIPDHVSGEDLDSVFPVEVQYRLIFVKIPIIIPIDKFILQGG